MVWVGNRRDPRAQLSVIRQAPPMQFRPTKHTKPPCSKPPSMEVRTIDDDLCATDSQRSVIDAAVDVAPFEGEVPHA